MTITEETIDRLLNVIDFYKKEARFQRALALFVFVAFTAMTVVCAYQRVTIAGQRDLIRQMYHDCPNAFADKVVKP